MRIAVVSTSRGMSAGYRNHLVNVMPLLRDVRGVNAAEVFAPEGSLAAADPSLAARSGGRGRKGLRRLVSGFQPDVILLPAARAFELPGIPTVTLVQNMEALTAPVSGNTLPEAARNVGRRVVIKRSCRRSRRVIAVSSYVRDFLLWQWHIPADKIGVVTIGVRPPLGPDDVEQPKGVPDGSFVFTAGSIRPARGLADALGALALMRARGKAFTLVIAGEATPGAARHKRSLERLASRLGVDTSVVWAGQLDQAEMGWCFRNCELFLATTRAEALSNVTLEVLSYGCLTVATDIGFAREVLAENAVYYPAGDTGRLADALCEARGLDDASRESWRVTAQRRAREYDWSVTAERTVAELALAIP
jgi:glycosyltransferase involved in cell wall biosynthesis